MLGMDTDTLHACTIHTRFILALGQSSSRYGSIARWFASKRSAPYAPTYLVYFFFHGFERVAFVTCGDKKAGRHRVEHAFCKDQLVLEVERCGRVGPDAGGARSGCVCVYTYDCKEESIAVDIHTHMHASKYFRRTEEHVPCRILWIGHAHIVLKRMSACKSI